MTQVIQYIRNKRNALTAHPSKHQKNNQSMINQSIITDPILVLQHSQHRQNQRPKNHRPRDSIRVSCTFLYCWCWCCCWCKILSHHT
nr:hypothetical protein CFP56_15146 [Quercus suber]